MAAPMSLKDRSPAFSGRRLVGRPWGDRCGCRRAVGRSSLLNILQSPLRDFDFQPPLGGRLNYPFP